MWHEIIDPSNKLTDTKLNVTKFYSNFNISTHKIALKLFSSCPTNDLRFSSCAKLV